MLWHGNKCGKNKSNENFNTTIANNNYDRPGQLENVKCFKYLGNMLTEAGRYTCEIKFSIAMANAVFNKKKNLFTNKLDLNWRKRLVRCYVWSIALYGAENWTLRATDQ